VGYELNVTNLLFDVAPLIFWKSEKTKSDIIFQPEIKQKAYGLFCKSGLIPRRSAAAHVRQRLQRFGIKPLPPTA
jgi:hypothetical protein